jgi:hypothetical protein
MAIVKLTGAALALTIFAGSALASGHLHDAGHSAGADKRGFHNPVVDNPSGVSGDAAKPESVPSTGNPKTGHES